MGRCRLRILVFVVVVGVVVMAGLSSAAASSTSRRALVSAFKVPPSPEAHRLAEFLEGCKRVVTVTGAGLSTESGIPDYRGPQGSYSRGHKPMVHDQFVSSPYHRSRYWARSMIGYERFSQAAPNAGHRALARMETELGIVHYTITQNVDGLHQRAGSEKVCDLHGRNDRVVCLGCGRPKPRRPFQLELESLNREWIDTFVPKGGENAQMFADGDVDLTSVDFDSFRVPSCDCCGGVLKPDVVFFGDVVPAPRVEEAFARVAEADAILVAGTSLMVYSGWRFVLDAAKRGTKIAVVNMGHTRAEKEGVEHLKLEAGCGDVLAGACSLLAGEASSEGSQEEAGVSEATAALEAAAGAAASMDRA